MKILFIINPASGNDKRDWPSLITEHFKDGEYSVELYHLQKDCSPESIMQKINEYVPQRVVAVGGDGTVKLVATCLVHSTLALGILPAGSANGMAKELKIPDDPTQAMDLVKFGETELIHLINVNDHYCIHLSDIGFNAYMVKKFETGRRRGHLGYLKAAWKAIWSNPRMQLKVQTDAGVVMRSAAMVVIANATKYGTSALINPNGKLNDDLFEIVIVRKISFLEIFKMLISHMPFDTTKTEVIQTSSVAIHSKRRVHFQVDGEYLNKVSDIHADIIPNALHIIRSGDPIKTMA
jgi:diacylglycerol kinase (ATP)